MTRKSTKKGKELNNAISPKESVNNVVADQAGEAAQLTAKHEPIITVEVPMDSIVFNSGNPRTWEDDPEFASFVADIAKNGLIHPITVREIEDGKYQIIAGERRYRAFLALKYEKISCNIKTFDDDQTTDIMMSENLMRQPLKPLDEAKKYQALIWEKQLSIQEVAVRFNQKPSYIYNRLALLNMIQEIAKLLTNETINLSVANEICKYPFDIQRKVYENHLEKDDYRCWLSLSAKVFKKKLEENYSTDLAQYQFDKTSCQTCVYNSEYLSMFPSENSYCKNYDCLKKMQAEHLTSKAILLAKDHPGAEINIPIQSSNVSDEVKEKLSELGVTALNDYSRDLPQIPEKPERKDFQNKTDYTEACQEYKQEEKQYKRAVSELETRVQEGKAKYVVDLQGNEPVLKYVNVAPLPSPTEDKPKEPDKKNIIEQLQAQEQKIQKSRKENTNTELSEFIKTSVNVTAPLNELEDAIFFSIALKKLRLQNRGKLNLKSWNKDQEELNLCQDLSEEQKNTIIRDCIIGYITTNPSETAELMVKFMELHFPEKLKAINQKHTDIYNEKHANIEEKLQMLIPQPPKKNRKNKEKQSAEQIIAKAEEENIPLIEEFSDRNDYIEEDYPGDFIAEDESPFEENTPVFPIGDSFDEYPEEAIEDYDYAEDYESKDEQDQVDNIIPLPAPVLNQQPIYN